MTGAHQALVDAGLGVHGRVARKRNEADGQHQGQEQAIATFYAGHALILAHSPLK